MCGDIYMYQLSSRKLYFFFSSRRRHTRLQGDWSSDGALPISDLSLTRQESARRSAPPRMAFATILSAPQRTPHNRRSEERRVGKECRRGRVDNKAEKKQ